jgi:hypothetical protein
VRLNISFIRAKCTSLLLAVLFLISCQRERVKTNLLTEEQFVDVYCAMLERDGQSSLTQSPADTTLTDRGRRVLKEMGVSEETFRATVRDYNDDVNRWRGFFERVTKRLERRTEEAKKPVP